MRKYEETKVSSLLKKFVCSIDKNMKRSELSKKRKKQQNEFISMTIVQHSCTELIYIAIKRL